MNDSELLVIAIERLQNYDPSKLIPEEQMNRELGITQEELDSVDGVEFE